MSLFHVIGSGSGITSSPRVHSFGQPPDVPSLSRSIPPLVNDDQRDAQTVQLMVEFLNAVLPGFELFQVVAL